MRKTTVALLMLAGAVGGAGWAQTSVTPKPGPGDSRIREVYYDRDSVVRVEGRLGYEMMIEFNPTERIENVSIGDALAWQVSPNRKATLLFLKPMATARDTSMTVVTSDHVYSFLLSVGDHTEMLRLRFLYLPSPPLPPPPAPPPPPPPPVLNRDYSSSGSNRFVPVSVFDDGTSTFFQFDPAKGIPAVFFIAPDGGEEAANTRMAGPYTVVDITAETFVVRYGNTKTELHNKAWSKRPLPRPAPYPVNKGE